MNLPNDRYVDPRWIEELRRVDPHAALVHVQDDSWMLGTFKPRWLTPDNGLARRQRGTRLLEGLGKLALRKSWIMGQCYLDNFEIVSQFNWRGEPPVGKLVREFAQADYLWRTRSDDQFLRDLEAGAYDQEDAARRMAMNDRVAYEGRAAYDFFLRKNRKIAVNGLKETAA